MRKLIVAQAERVINRTEERHYFSQPMPRNYSRHKAHAAPVKAPTAIQLAFVNAVVRAQSK